MVSLLGRAQRMSKPMSSPIGPTNCMRMEACVKLVRYSSVRYAVLEMFASGLVPISRLAVGGLHGSNLDHCDGSQDRKT